MEVTSSPTLPARKNEPPLSNSLPQKNTKPPGPPFPESLLKKLKFLSVMECQCETFHVKHRATNSFWQNIKWLLANNTVGMDHVYIKGKNVYGPSLYTFSIQCFGLLFGREST